MLGFTFFGESHTFTADSDKEVQEKIADLKELTQLYGWGLDEQWQSSFVHAHLRDHHLSDFEMQTLDTIGRSRTPTASVHSHITVSASVHSHISVDSSKISIASAADDLCEHASLFLDETPALPCLQM